jgi:hypothetical protein|tara:strand:- start:360 stop:593 length:234 start_codon:yes stop_codon:yes gene_type:complete
MKLLTEYQMNKVKKIKREQTKKVKKRLLEKIKWSPKYSKNIDKLTIKIINSVDRYLKYILSEFEDHERDFKKKSKSK